MLAASGYVLYHRYNEDAEGRYKLLLRCLLIITSVVPTELPMQLALVVNTSLVALVRAMIFCTEPHRIPYARKVYICCFDKTGTITTDAIKAAGVALAPDQVQEANKTENTDLEEYPVFLYMRRQPHEPSLHGMSHHCAAVMVHHTVVMVHPKFKRLHHSKNHFLNPC